MKIVCLALTLVVCLAGFTYTAEAVETVSTTVTLTGTKNLISLPCIPLDTNPMSVFTGISIDNNLTSWDPVDQVGNIYSTANPDAFGGILAGEGYWVNGAARQRFTYQSFTSGVQIDGIPTDTWIPLPGSDDGMNKGGRNLIGCPYNNSIPVSSIQFTNGVDIKSWSAAYSAGWVSSTISYWTDSGYNNITCNGPSSVIALQPGRGYWVQTNVDNLAMIISAPSQGYTLSSTVHLGNYDQSKCAGVPVNVQLYIGSELIRTVDTELDADSRLHIYDVQPGTYSIGIKPSHWLRRVVPSVTVINSDMDFTIH